MSAGACGTASSVGSGVGLLMVVSSRRDWVVGGRWEVSMTDGGGDDDDDDNDEGGGGRGDDEKMACGEWDDDGGCGGTRASDVCVCVRVCEW
jgi:hypothetical protein